MKTIFTVLTVILLSSQLYSQRSNQSPNNVIEKPNKPAVQTSIVNKMQPFGNADVSFNQQTPREKELYAQIREARKSNNRNEIKRLNSELNTLNGVVTKRGENIGHFGKERFENSAERDANVSPVMYENNIMAVTTVTEQRGSNKGRIWNVVASNYYGKPYYSYIDYFYSDDKGVNWTSYAYSENPFELNVEDAIDAEIIENNTGTKFLYVSTGATTISDGKYICLLSTLNISGTVSGSVQRLEWPGFNYFDTDVNYFKPRITSDNAFWNGAAYLYIAAGADSLNGGAYDFSERAALITNPYNDYPSIDYKAYAFFYYSFGDPFYQGACDIAWFDDPLNGGGSIILAESGAFFVTAIYMYEATDVGYLSSSTYIGYLDPDGIDKSSAYIASNGLYQDLMIVNVSEYSPTDNDIQYFSTSNAGVNWTTGFVSYTFGDDERADITGFRNSPGRFNCAHSEEDVSFNKVYYAVARNNSWGAQISPMNVYDASYSADPRPGLRLDAADSCLVVWSENPNTNVWSTSGCDALNQSREFYVSAFIEGFYQPGIYTMNRQDTVLIKFRQAVSPYNVVDAGKTVLSQSGYGGHNFTILNVNTNYYVTLNHRNSIETWSSLPINFTGGYYYYYNFISSDTYAYGANEKFLDNDGFADYYGIFSGDVNQEGSVDLSDIILIFNDANNFASGYVVTDLTGDDFVDLSDITVAYNNSINFVAVVRP